MQIESLKVFCDLAETESFTKAAQLNEVTQSAVSQQISALERTLKVVLIERGKKKFRLTDEGQVFYEAGREMLGTYEKLAADLVELKRVISGTLRVAVIYTFGLHDLPVYLKRYLQRFPSVNVHVEYRHARQIYEDVLGNTVDVGLVAYPRKDPRLVVVPLREDRLVVITHPQHPLARAKSIKLATLSGQKFIAFEDGVPIRQAIDKIFRHYRVRVQGAMEFDNIETLKRAVEIDAGIAIVPESTVAEETSMGTLAAMGIADAEFHRPLAAIHRRNKTPGQALKEFLAVLKG